MKTSGYLIGTLIELTSGMEHCHDDFQSALVHLLMFVHGDTAAVVLHRYRVVLVDGHLYVCAEARHGLVNRVVQTASCFSED